MTPVVIPAEAGIHNRCRLAGAAASARLDSRLRGNDGVGAARA
jgi:hypothetical protein